MGSVREASPPKGRSPFVGRSDELQRLLSALQSLRNDGGHLALISGVAGIGKTRLAHELAVQAPAHGVRVIWGRCWEGSGAPPFWPWVQILRVCAEIEGPAGESPRRGDPTVKLLQDSPRPQRLRRYGVDQERERLRLFDGIASRLRDAARRQPLAVLLDDLHFADAGSLAALPFVAAQLTQTPVLLLATLRDEDSAKPELRDAIAALSKLPQCARLALRELSRDDTQRYIDATLEHAEHTGLVDDVFRRTEGHPLFLVELVESLRSGNPSRGGVPPSVGALIDNKLAALDAGARTTLRVAATIGREFSATLLSRARRMPTDATHLQLRAAQAQRLVENVDPLAVTWRFAHAMIQEALYESTAVDERAEAHAALAEAFETESPEDEPRRLSALAHHYAAAAAARLADKAAQYAQHAAEHAVSVGAYEEATRHCTNALQWLDNGAHDPHLRFAVLLTLGEALRCLGDLPGARTTFLQAASLARILRDGTLLARVGVAMAEETTPGYEDQELVHHLEEALGHLPPGDSSLRAQALVTLAFALGGHGTWSERCEQLVCEALAIAQRIGDPQAELIALNARRDSLVDPHELLAVADRVVSLAGQIGDLEWLAYGHWFRRSDLLMLGRVAESHQAQSALGKLARQLRQPRFRYYEMLAEVMYSILAGRFGETQQKISEAWEVGRNAVNGQVADDFAWMQYFGFYREQGRLEELEGALREAVRRYPTYFSARAALVLMLTEIDRLSEASAVLQEVIPDDSFDPPPSTFRVSGLAVLATACHRVGDAERAAILARLLLPYSGMNVVVGNCIVCQGATDSYLAILHATMHRWPEAQRYFEAAIAQNSRLASAPLVAQTQLDYARMQARRGLYTDARRLLEEAERTFMQLAMQRATQSCADLRQEIQRSKISITDEKMPRRDGPRPSIHFGNGVCTIRFAGTTSRFKDLKGLRYIAQLLSQPHIELHCSEIVAAANGVPALVAGDLGTVVDRRALDEYRRRLAELTRDLEEAETQGDLAAAERIPAEQQAIYDAIAAAVGLRGQARRLSPVEERARVNVKNCIREALSAIAASNEPLWRHLRNSIQTGTFCSYRPEHTITWEQPTLLAAD